jgi:phosphate uptake regulator
VIATDIEPDLVLRNAREAAALGAVEGRQMIQLGAEAPVAAGQTTRVAVAGKSIGRIADRCGRVPDRGTASVAMAMTVCVHVKRTAVSTTGYDMSPVDIK